MHTYILLTDIITDKWRFSSNRFNTTNILVSGWNVIPEYMDPIFTATTLPATGTLGKYNAHFYLKLFYF